MQRGQTLIFILIGLIFLVLVVSGAFYLGRMTAPNSQVINPVITSQTPAPTLMPVDETSNWKTYKNEIFNFEFRYPDNFQLTDNLPTKYQSTTGSNDYLLLSDGTKMGFTLWINPAGFGPFFSNKLVFVDYTEKRGLFIIDKSTQDISKYRNDDNIEIMTQPKQIQNKSISILFNYRKGVTEGEQTFKQILSTFRFPQQESRQVSWEEAIKLLNNGSVVGVFQEHSLYVRLNLNNGTTAETTEPYIDAIFRELEKCEVCKTTVKSSALE